MSKAKAFATWFAIGLGYVVAVLAVHPMLVTGELFLGWDAVEESWPELVYALGAFMDGELPLWNPYERAGYPFVAHPQAGVLYPLNWIVYGAGALFGDGAWLSLVRQLLHFAIAGIGMHLLIKRLNMPVASRWLGGIGFILCARMAKNIDNAGLWTAAWLPLILVAVDQVVRRPKLRWGVALGAVLALSLLAGYPPDFFRNMFVIAPWFLFSLWKEVKPLPRRGEHLRRVALCLAAGAAAASLMALPQIIASLEVYPYSTRADLSLAEAVRSGLRPISALAFFSSRVTEPPFFYCFPFMGVLTIMLGATAAVRWSDRRRLLWTIGAVFFFLLACGQNGLLLPALARVVPLFGMFRNPEVYLYSTALFIALLAARGMADALTGSADRRKVTRVGLIVVGVVALGVAVTGWVRASDAALVRHGMAASGLVLVTALLGIFGLCAWRSQVRVVAAWIALGVLLVDLGVQNERLHKIGRPYPRLRNQLKGLDVKDISSGTRIANDYHFSHRVGLRKGVRDLFGRNQELKTRRYDVYSKAARRNANMLMAANVRYYAGRNSWTISRQLGIPGGKVIELPKYAPVAYWTGQVTVVDNEKLALSKMRQTRPGSSAIIEAPDLSDAEKSAVASMQDQRPAVPATLTRPTRNAVEISVAAPAPGMLAISEAYFPGWEAQLDGQPAKIVRCNYLFRCVRVEAGEHKVSMQYRPAKLIIALWIYLATLLGLVLWCSALAFLAQRDQKRG